MANSDVELSGDASLAAGRADRLLLLAQYLPRPLRFLGVGTLGLVTDLSVFTAFAAHDLHPLLARLISLAAATLVTWRLNRALTFDRSHRHQAKEAVRYVAVTVTAQGASYAIFAALILALPAWRPQAALLIGAVAGAVIAYCGHRFFVFAPRRSGITRR
jgi:putative flippase GtrA